MTTLAANSPMTKVKGDNNSIPIIADDIVYEGAMAGDNASGYGRPLVAGDNFVGHSIDKVDNTGGSAGDKNIQLLTGKYRLVVDLVGLITDVGQPVYASDDSVLTFSAPSNSFVGVISRYVSATRMEVEFWPSSPGQSVLRRMVTLTSAQILLLETTQIELIPAPGADKVIQVLALQMILDYGSNVFTEPSAPDDLEVVYDAAGGTSIADVIGDFIIHNADNFAQPQIKDIAGAAATTMVNKAVVLDNNGSNYGGNAGDDSLLHVMLTYVIHRALLA